MEQLDSVVAEHIEQHLHPKRLEQILSRVLDRREERAKSRTGHIAELRKRAAEADAKLKRLYDAIENGIADVSDPMLKERVTELKAVRDQARADAERAESAWIGLGRASHRRRSKPSRARPAGACGTRPAATAATTCGRWPSGWKSTQRNSHHGVKSELRARCAAQAQNGRWRPGKWRARRDSNS